jgi:hypothetical protein
MGLGALGEWRRTAPVSDCNRRKSSNADLRLDKWDRPPNFLLVDYYNWGKPNGSVFAVAAEMNNVSYNYNCCGLQSGASSVTAGVHGLGVMLAIAGIHLLLGTL